jgi:uncharacterized protein (TIGR00730 family)
MSLMQRICVYCGSSDDVSPEYLESAREMGVSVARRGLSVVYGAGSTGLMGALADAALGAGGEVIGVITEQFNTPELVHLELTRLEVVADMHTRKARLVDLGDAFVALPGGFGTLEELFEALTWAQIGLHRKPIGLLNSRGYFDPLLKLIEHAYQEGFIYAEHRFLFTHAEDPERLLDLLGDHSHPEGLERWLTRDD